MKITRRKLKKLILESVGQIISPVDKVSSMLIEIISSFEELGYEMFEVPMWEVVSAMTEKIDVDPSLLEVYSAALSLLANDSSLLTHNDHFDDQTLSYVLREAIKDYKSYNSVSLKEELERMSYVSKSQGFTYGVEHVTKKNKAVDDIIGHT
jgi:hypothetical protein